MANEKPNDLDIAGLRELEAKATNANWACPKEHKDGTVQVYATHNGPLRCCVPVANTMKDDGKFIAAIRNAAVDLLALAEIGQAAVEEYQYECACNFPFANRERLKRLKICKAYLARKDG